MPAFEQHRDHVEQMIAAALEAADPATAVLQNLRQDGQRLWVGRAPASWRYELARGRIYVVAVGKAAVPMGRAALQVLQEHAAEAILIGKQGEPGVGRRYRAAVSSQVPVTVFEAGHPVSDETSIRATAAVLAMLEQTRPGDLLLCLISGGTSALLTQPVLTGMAAAHVGSWTAVAPF